MSPRSPDFAQRLETIVAGYPPDEARSAIEALRDLVAIAQAEHGDTWTEAELLARHALHHAGNAAAGEPGPLAARIAQLRPGDLYLALACAHGVADAVKHFDAEHLAHVADFVARIDSTPAFADEVRQRLRHRLLVGTPEEPARVLGYSGRGPLGGWLRVCAVREARAIAKDHRRNDPIFKEVASDDVDPELAHLKRKYGEAVSEAFRRALDSLDGDDRTMLRMHYLDGLTIEEVGALFKMSRATAARTMSRARQRLVDAVREDLADVLGVGRGEADSLLAFVRSRIDVSLRKHLG